VSCCAVGKLATSRHACRNLIPMRRAQRSDDFNTGWDIRINPTSVIFCVGMNNIRV
jgi:hypothetical protein